MTPFLSLYLDALRLLAAVAVLIGHAHGYILPSIPTIIASHADEGVAVFFVISGFVIAYVLNGRESDWRGYAAARFVRMFSVIPIALSITFAADYIGYYLIPAGYDRIWFYSHDYFQSLIRAITFTNEIWAQSSTFGSNHAYWSLGFEVQYYLAFGLLWFLDKRWSAIAILAWMAFSGPLIVMYFPLWGFGVLAYQLIVSRVVTSKRVGIALFVLAGAIYIIMGLKFRDLKIVIPYWEQPDKLLDSFLYYMVTGFAVMLSILAAGTWKAVPKFINRRLSGPIRWLAGGSFSLYLIHEPLLVFAHLVLPMYSQSQATRWVALIVIITICYLAAELGERRKGAYRHAFKLIARRLLPRRLA